MVKFLSQEDDIGRGPSQSCIEGHRIVPDVCYQSCLPSISEALFYCPNKFSADTSAANFSSDHQFAEISAKP